MENILELQKNQLGHPGTQEDFIEVLRSLKKVTELPQLHKNYLGPTGCYEMFTSLDNIMKKQKNNLGNPGTHGEFIKYLQAWKIL